MYDMMNYYGYTPFGWYGFCFEILWWVIVIVGIILLVWWIAPSRRTRWAEKSPLDIVGERYARGEINKEEFEEKMKTLG